MAAGTWKIYAAAKRKIGTGGNAMTAGGITLGVGVFKMSLHRASASANIKVLSTRSTFASIGSEISARGGYVANGRNIKPATGKWSAKNSAKQMVFYMSTIGLAFTANGSALNNIKYALIRTSSSASGGKVLCFCTLSTAQFTISSPNVLTITVDATNGFFTLV